MKSSNYYRLICAVFAALYMLVYAGQQILQDRIQLQSAETDLRYIDTSLIKTPKGYFTPNDTIIEKNKNKLEHIVDHDFTHLLAYLDGEGDIEECRKVWEDLTALSNEICDNVEPEDGVDIEYLKIQALARYVAFNTYYDWEAANTSVTEETISLKYAMEKNRTTCAGFSNFLAALCAVQGYDAVNVRGSGINLNEYSPTDLTATPKNHEWVGIYYDNRIIWVDVTWMSTNRYLEIYRTGFSPRHVYFDMSMEFMSIDHRIDLAEYRHFKEMGAYLTENIE